MINKADAKVVDFHDAWTFAAVESALALETWRTARDAEKADTYGAYVASLDREEQAATVLAERLGRTAATPLRATG
jgi:hypothetical protein